MRSQFRRFLLAVSLATSFCSSSLCPKTAAHDFPLSGVACPYADCFLDSPDTFFPFNDCDAEVARPTGKLSRAYMALAGRDMVTRALSTVAGWANQWDRWQQQVDAQFPIEHEFNADVSRSEIFATLPDEGVPPAPAAKRSLEVANYWADGSCDFNEWEFGEPCFGRHVASEPIAESEEIADESPCQPPVPESRNLVVRNPFAAGMADEYAAYDYDERDSHWLSGVRLGGNSESLHQRNSTDIAQGRAESKSSDWIESGEDLAIAVPVANDEGDICQPIGSCPEEAEATKTADDQSTPSASPVRSEETLNLREAIGRTLNGLDEFTCVLHCELSDLSSFESAGYGLGNWLASASQIPGKMACESVEYFASTQTNSIIPPLMYVLYTTTEGVAVVVPAEMARAWNITPETENALAVNDNSATETDFSALRAKLLIKASEQLDWLGIRLLQAADKLSDWAETQIAQSPSVSANR